jgi:hypothetical protein
LQSLKLLTRAIFKDKKTTTAINNSHHLPDILLSKKKSTEAVQEVLQKVDDSRLDFSLHRDISRISNAGLGVYLNGATQKPGSIVSFYPGSVYLPSDPIFFASLSNEYILKCYDGICVDGKSTGLSGRIYQSIYNRENWPGAIQISDNTWTSTQDKALR